MKQNYQVLKLKHYIKVEESIYTEEISRHFQQKRKGFIFLYTCIETISWVLINKNKFLKLMKKEWKIFWKLFSCCHNWCKMLKYVKAKL